MNKNEAEVVIKETIEYANKEIEKNKKKSKNIILAVICGFVVLIAGYFLMFKMEIPLKYSDDLIKVVVPKDGGLDVYVNVNNYKSADGVLVKTSDGYYDLYIGVTQTLSTKFIKNDNPNTMRVGNGIIVDFNSNTLIEYLPEQIQAESIMNVYYIDKLTDEIKRMDDSELVMYTNKTLVWSR